MGLHVIRYYNNDSDIDCNVRSVDNKFNGSNSRRIRDKNNEHRNGIQIRTSVSVG